MIFLCFRIETVGKYCLYFSKVDDQSAPFSDPLDRSGDELMDAVSILFIDHIPFSTAEPLRDHLLCCLRCNPSKIMWCNLYGYPIAELTLRVNFSCLL